jgi:hypothetical protein
MKDVAHRFIVGCERNRTPDVNIIRRRHLGVHLDVEAVCRRAAQDLVARIFSIASKVSIALTRADMPSSPLVASAFTVASSWVMTKESRRSADPCSSRRDSPRSD